MSGCSVFPGRCPLLNLLELLPVEQKELPGLGGRGHVVPRLLVVAVNHHFGVVEQARAVVSAANEGGADDEDNGERGGLVVAAQEELEGSHIWLCCQKEGCEYT